MRGEILIPYKKADFLRESIKDLENMRDCDIRGYDNYSDDWYAGFKVGLNNAIFILRKHIEAAENE